VILAFKIVLYLLIFKSLDVMARCEKYFHLLLILFAIFSYIIMI